MPVFSSDSPLRVKNSAVERMMGTTSEHPSFEAPVFVE
jgi:hypothetical protein